MKQNKSKKSNTSNTSNTSSNKLVFILTIVIFLLLVSLFVYVVFKKYSNKKTVPDLYNMTSERMANMSESDGKSDNLTMNDSGGCTATSDVVGFCVDYDKCCSIKSNNKCICEHPIVTNCKSQYDNCIKTESKDKCKTDNAECCNKYNDISINSNNFGPPIQRNQNDSILCNLLFIKNLEQKCLELCQTNPNCVSYSTTKTNCNLYSAVTDYQPKLDMNGVDVSNKNINYYIKKT